MTLHDLHKITKSVTKFWIYIKGRIDHIGVLQPIRVTFVSHKVQLNNAKFICSFVKI